MIKKYIAISILTTLLISVSAVAETNNPNIRAGFYFGTAMGSGATFIGFAHDTYGPTKHHDTGYQLNAGYAWAISARSLFGIEIDYNQLPKTTEAGSNTNISTPPTTNNTNSSSSANSTTLFASLNGYFGNSNLYFIGKIGMGLMSQHFVQVGTRISGDPLDNPTITPINIDVKGSNLMLFTDLGLGYSFTPNISLTLEMQNSSGSSAFWSNAISFPFDMDWSALDRTGLPTYAFLAGLNFRL